LAWIDDRVWCHPKLTDASDAAAWTWVKSIAYSSGFNTGGRLTPGQQKAVGASPRVRRELLERGLWNEAGGDITIHDWADHNSKRDARRAADRERKRQERRGQSAGTSAGRSAGQSGGNAAEKVADRRTLNARRRAPDDGSEGSEVTVLERRPLSRTAEATAQTLVGEFVDACHATGIEAPRRVIGQIAQATGKLIGEGTHPDAIRAGYRRMIQRGIVQPSLLPNFVAEASIPNGLRTTTANGGMTPAQILEATRGKP
jgi:hypothetical protein